MLQSLPPDFFNFNISDVASVLLSLALVVLYWRMQKLQNNIVSVQEKQADIMRRQTSFMKADHEPVVEVEGLSGEDNSINITLTNRGNGPARNLLLHVVVYKQSEFVEDEPINISPGYRGKGSVIGPEWTHLWKVPPEEYNEKDTIEGPNGGIESGDVPTDFTSDLTFSYMTPGTGEYEVTFSEMMQRISKEWDCDYIALDIHIAYTNIAWEFNAIPAGSVGNIPVNSDLTIEEALDNPHIGGPLGDPVSKEEVASMIMMDDINLG